MCTALDLQTKAKVFQIMKIFESTFIFEKLFTLVNIKYMHINAQKQHIALLIHLGHRINSPKSVEIKNENILCNL